MEDFDKKQEETQLEAPDVHLEDANMEYYLDKVKISG